MIKIYNSIRRINKNYKYNINKLKKVETLKKIIMLK